MLNVNIDMKKICTLSPLHHSCILILGPSKLHRASRKNPHRSKIWEVYTIYWFEYIQSAQKFVISWRTKQKWCSLNKIQVLVRSYFFTEVNIHDKLYIKKDTAISEILKKTFIGLNLWIHWTTILIEVFDDRENRLLELV